MANPRATKGVKELGKKSMKTTKGGGAVIQELNPQPEPPGAAGKLGGRTGQVIGPEI